MRSFLCLFPKRNDVSALMLPMRNLFNASGASFDQRPWITKESLLLLMSVCQSCLYHTFSTQEQTALISQMPKSRVCFCPSVLVEPKRPPTAPSSYVTRYMWAISSFPEDFFQLSCLGSLDHMGSTESISIINPRWWNLCRLFPRERHLHLTRLMSWQSCLFDSTSLLGPRPEPSSV